MQPRALRIIGLVALAALTTGTAPAGIDATTRPVTEFGRLPLRFEKKQGQSDPSVAFVARGSGYAVFLQASHAVMAVGTGERQAGVRMSLRGANAAARVTPLDKLETLTNYLMGTDAAEWRTGVPSYARVRYHGVYP